MTIVLDRQKVHHSLELQLRISYVLVLEVERLFGKMSLFTKKKRNIRLRNFTDDNEDNENRMDTEDIQPLRPKSKKKDKPSLLSFGEELEEGK